MECTLVDRQRYTALRSLVDQSARTFASATMIIDLLNQTFAEPHTYLGPDSMRIKPSGTQSFEFTVASGVSEGRITYAAEIVDGVYVGTLLLWKKSFDEAGAQVWRKVWKLYLPVNQSPYYLDGGEQKVLEIRGPSSADVIFSIGLTFIVRLMEE